MMPKNSRATCLDVVLLWLLANSVMCSVFVQSMCDVFLQHGCWYQIINMYYINNVQQKRKLFKRRSQGASTIPEMQLLKIKMLQWDEFDFFFSWCELLFCAGFLFSHGLYHTVHGNMMLRCMNLFLNQISLLMIDKILWCKVMFTSWFLY